MLSEIAQHGTCNFIDQLNEDALSYPVPLFYVVMVTTLTLIVTLLDFRGQQRDGGCGGTYQRDAENL